MSRFSLAQARRLVSVLVAWVALLVWLAPSTARAGTPYGIRWDVTQENPSCETAALLDHNGDSFFHVNATPLPGNEIPGALVTNPDGSESNTVEAGLAMSRIL